ncbi:MAG: zf-HC2 domain-containing protein [Blastocatellia bacterium]
MKCEDCQTMIEEYADGALDQKGAALMNSHMASCHECESFYRELNREQEIYARYERDLEVTPLLWSSIEARIKQEQAAKPVGLLSRLKEVLAGAFAAPRLSPAFAAALVMIAIGVTVAVMSYLNTTNRDQLAANNKNAGAETAGAQKESGTVPAPVPAQPANPASQNAVAQNGGAISQAPDQKVRVTPPRKNPGAKAAPSPEQLVREAEQKYLTAIAILSRDVNRQRSQLDPIMLARFDASLNEIDRTINETRRVVRENPGDPIALQYLLAAYSKKVDMLRGMTTD